MKPVVRNSDLVTTGTARPRNAVWRCTSNGSGVRPPPCTDQRNTFSTSLPTSMRYPRIPCWAGASPVAIDVSADAVVAGVTVVIGPPVMPASTGMTAACSRSAFQPNPSSTSRTTASAPRTGSGSQESSCTPMSAGTSPATDAPSSAGRTAPTRDEVIRGSVEPRPAGPGRRPTRGLRDDGGMRMSTRGDYAARSAAVARAARDRTTDLGEGDRGAHTPSAAVPRADPAVGQGRRARALQAGCRRRLRARPRHPRDHARRHRRRGRGAADRARTSTPTTARVTASSRRCGSASTTSRAASSNGSRSPSSSSARASATPTPSPADPRTRRIDERAAQRDSSRTRSSTTSSSGGNGSSKRIRSPVAGWSNPSVAACRNGRASGIWSREPP